MCDHLRIFFVTLAVAALAACGGGGGDSSELKKQFRTYTRATQDQIDTQQDGFNVHFVYAVPKGGADRGRDINYQLQTSVFAANKWFYKISGGQKFILDVLPNGDLDITYWEIPLTEGELQKFDWLMRDEIERQLKKTLWYSKNKIYVVYFEGAHLYTCGDAPSSGGHVAVMYLSSAVSNSSYRCGSDLFATSEDQAGFKEHSMIHEAVHVLGVTHTSDSSTDLMYFGSQPWMPSVVDYGSNDYYNTPVGSQLNIRDSIFLTPRLGNLLPKGWRDFD
jgi:hypothetical protein